MLVTEWHEFRRPSFERLKSLLKQPVLFDGRNIWSPAELRAAGFTYYGIGRGKAARRLASRALAGLRAARRHRRRAWRSGGPGAGRARPRERVVARSCRACGAVASPARARPYDDGSAARVGRFVTARHDVDPIGIQLQHADQPDRLGRHRVRLAFVDDRGARSDQNGETQRQIAQLRS